MQRKARESHVLVTRSDGLHASFDGIKHAVIYSGSAGRRAAATSSVDVEFRQSLVGPARRLMGPITACSNDTPPKSSRGRGAIDNDVLSSASLSTVSPATEVRRC